MNHILTIACFLCHPYAITCQESVVHPTDRVLSRINSKDRWQQISKKAEQKHKDIVEKWDDTRKEVITKEMAPTTGECLAENAELNTTQSDTVNNRKIDPHQRKIIRVNSRDRWIKSSKKAKERHEEIVGKWEDTRRDLVEQEIGPEENVDPEESEDVEYFVPLHRQKLTRQGSRDKWIETSHKAKIKYDNAVEKWDDTREDLLHQRENRSKVPSPSLWDDGSDYSIYSHRNQEYFVLPSIGKVARLELRDRWRKTSQKAQKRYDDIVGKWDGTRIGLLQKQKDSASCNQISTLPSDQRRMIRHDSKGKWAKTSRKAKQRHEDIVQKWDDTKGYLVREHKDTLLETLPTVVNPTISHSNSSNVASNEPLEAVGKKWKSSGVKAVKSKKEVTKKWSSMTDQLQAKKNTTSKTDEKSHVKARLKGLMEKFSLTSDIVKQFTTGVQQRVPVQRKSQNKSLKQFIHKVSKMYRSMLDMSNRHYL